MAATQIQASPSPENNRRRLLMAIGTVVVVILVLIVLAILLNWGSFLDGITNVLTWIFSPDKRVDPANIVVCRTNSACSTIHAFVYSAILLFVVITGFAYTTLLERKLIAWFQQRSGPNRVGPFGLLQPAADGIKLAFKEDIEPTGVLSKPIFTVAPMIKVLPILLVLAVIPLGPDLLIPWFDGKWYQIPLVLADVNVAVLWILGITSISAYGIVLAGWSSNNKYSMLGGMRASAQVISYELTLGLSMAVPVMIVGSMNMRDIVSVQPMFWNWFFLQNPLAAFILFTAFLAEINRSPFDLPEAEQELTGGYFTEYSGMKFAAFMMAEYLGMISISMIVISPFFGGYQDGFGLVNSVPILGPLVIIGKVILFLVFMVWIRATLPRIRYDRLMSFGWKVLLPLALVAVAWTAVSLVVGDSVAPQDSVVAYGIVAGIFFVVVAGFLFLLVRRSGEAAGEQDDEDEALINDPIVTGEQSGVGYAILNVLGAVLAPLFSLYGWIIDRLDAVARTSPNYKPRETGITVVDDKPSQPATRR
jgi:NADH-quinone oxidoreductase subunit H